MAVSPGDAPRAAEIADTRLRHESHWRKRWLTSLVRRKYKLTIEDCEQIANDTLLAWHRELLSPEGVGNDRAFCQAVALTQAIERLRRKSLQTVELSVAEDLGINPQLDVQPGEREEIDQLRELATAVLEPQEYESSMMVADGIPRGIVATQLGLTLRQVKRLRATAQAKLDAGRAALPRHGLCGMLRLSIEDVAHGRIEAGSNRWTVAHKHLARCRRCRRDVASLARRVPDADIGAIRGTGA